MTVRVGGVDSVAGPILGGLLLLLFTAGWWTASALEADTSPAGASGLILAAALTLWISWMVASRRPTLALAGLVGAAAAVFVADAAATLRSGPSQGPFGYANATAAFFAQACVAALMLVALARGPLRAVAAIAAAGFAAIVLITESWTAALALPLVVLAALVAERARGGSAPVMVCGGLFAAALVSTIVLGAWGGGSGSGVAGRVIDETISGNRVALWNEALSITAEHALTGVGPGRFAQASAIASSDADLRWAHHEFLQAGAETGLVGYTLAVGVFLWGFLALGGVSPGPVVALSAAGLAILGIHASFDYVLHFPFVTIAGAAVLGAGLGAARGAPGRVHSFVARAPVREAA
jgi:O-antigen ligase